MITTFDLNVLRTVQELCAMHGVTGAYGVTIQDHMRAHLMKRREPSIGSIYASLDKLETEGFVIASEGEATAERHGKRKLYFTITEAGAKAIVADNIRHQERLIARVKPVLAGNHPDIQGAVLAELLARFIAGTHPLLRETILTVHIDMVRKLVPVCEAELFQRGKPPGWDAPPN